MARGSPRAAGVTFTGSVSRVGRAVASPSPASNSSCVSFNYKRRRQLLLVPPPAPPVILSPTEVTTLPCQPQHRPVTSVTRTTARIFETQSTAGPRHLPYKRRTGAPPLGGEELHGRQPRAGPPPGGGDSWRRTVRGTGFWSPTSSVFSPLLPVCLTPCSNRSAGLASWGPQARPPRAAVPLSRPRHAAEEQTSGPLSQVFAPNPPSWETAETGNASQTIRSRILAMG